MESLDKKIEWKPVCQAVPVTKIKEALALLKENRCRCDIDNIESDIFFHKCDFCLDSLEIFGEGLI